MPELLVAKKSGELVIRVDLEGRSKLTMGRSPRCDLVLSSSAISRHHALLFEELGRWYVLDVGSRTGVWTGQGRVQSAQLTEDQWVRLGPAHLWISDLPRPPQSPPPLLDPEFGKVALRSEYVDAFISDQ